MDIIERNEDDEDDDELSSCSSSEEGNAPHISVSTPTSIPGRPSSLSSQYQGGKYVKVKPETGVHTATGALTMAIHRQRQSTKRTIKSLHDSCWLRASRRPTNPTCLPTITSMNITTITACHLIHQQSQARIILTARFGHSNLAKTGGIWHQLDRTVSFICGHCWLLKIHKTSLNSLSACWRRSRTWNTSDTRRIFWILHGQR